MSKPAHIQTRLRALAERDGQRITRADVRMALLAAEMIDRLDGAAVMADNRAASLTREACNSGALVSVVRSELQGLLDLIGGHA